MDSLRFNQLLNVIQHETQKRRTIRALKDLHYFTFNIAMPDRSELYPLFSTIDGLPEKVLKHLLEQKGIDWFHWYWLDMYRYQSRTAGETAQNIPLYTPLGAEMRKWEKEKNKSFCVRLWIPNRDKWLEPVIEYGQQNDDSEMPPCETQGSPPEGLYIRWYPTLRNTTTITARQMLKSTINRAVDAWILARNPLARIILISATDDTAREHVSTVRNILESKEWETFFPNIRQGDTWSVKDGLKLDAGRRSAAKEANYVGAGVKTGLTGGHCDVIRFDDLEDERCLGMPTLMQSAKEKYFEVKEQIGDAGSYVSTIGTIWVGDDSGLM